MGRPDDRDRSLDRDRDRNRERKRHRDKDIDRDRDRDRYREYERRRDREHERDYYRRRHRSGSRESSRRRSSRERHRRDRDRDRDRYRHRDRDRRRRSSSRSRSRSERRSSSRSVDTTSASKPSDDLQSPKDLKRVSRPQNEYLLAESAIDENSTSENGQNNNHKNEPISLEELLKKKKQEEEEANKPVFLSKEERKKLRQQQALEERRRLAEEKRKEVAKLSRPQQNGTESHNEEHMDPERQRELEAIRQQYLGKKQEKSRHIKPSEKFKLSWDWDASEDTTKDANSLLDRPHEAALLFGRGRRAGIDWREQQKHAEFYDKLARERKRELKRKREEETEDLLDRPSKQRRKKKKKKGQGLDVAMSTKHWTEKRREEMTERDWRIFKEDNNIVTKGGAIPHPIRSWDEADLPKKLQDAIDAIGYKEPTPVQKQCLPIALKNRDVLGVAETGSGKTAAFVIPMLVYISQMPPIDDFNYLEGPYALVLAPTRELAQQIETETRKFADPMGYRVMSVVGGVSFEEQALQMQKGAEILIATPGRLNDCLDRRYIVLNQCHYLVMDEADRMIAMGFEEQVKSILDSMPSSNVKPENEEDMEENVLYRQTFMFSATMPPSVERLAQNYLRKPATVSIGEVGQAVERIKQEVEFVSEESKRRRLLNLVEQTDPPIIVFVNYKKTADSLAKYLTKMTPFRAVPLHGGKHQDLRESTIGGFKSGESDVLVATDVAGRGLDVKGVTHVINFDCPSNIDDYVHRIGRTGRAGESGLATTFLTKDNTEIFYELRKMLEKTKNRVPEELASHEAAQVRPGTAPMQKRKDQVIFL